MKKKIIKYFRLFYLSLKGSEKIQVSSGMEKKPSISSPRFMHEKKNKKNKIKIKTHIFCNV